MNFAMISAVSGGLAALDRLDAIATNLANVSTTGFKSLLHSQVADKVGESQPSGSVAPSTPVNRSRVVSDFGQGGVDDTGNPLHLALDGPGFFVVDTPQGERLTRRGSFTVDEEGYLATAEGHRVQGDGADLLVGDLAQRGALSIGKDGTVTAGNKRIGQVRVVEGGDSSRLHREPGGLYRSTDPELVPQAQTAYVVHQGALENSNVSAVENLVAMIEAMRGFEAYMNTLDRIDTINERSIRDVGRV